MKKDKKVKLSPPWHEHMAMLKAFFAGDDRIAVGDCGDDKVAFIGVKDAELLSAMNEVLAKRVRFGNAALKIEVVPANGIKEKKVKAMSKADALKTVLKGNPAFCKFMKKKTPTGFAVFALFEPFVLQWYADNIGSPWKLRTAVYEQAALRVFRNGLGVSFATERDDI